jgi:hypothetical protein
VSAADAVASAFAQAGQDPGAFAYAAKPGPPTGLRTFLGEDTVLTVAVDDEGRRQNLLEVACRTWAGAHGVGCPAVLATAPDGGWLHAERVRAGRPEGTAYVHAALDAADRVAAAPLPDLPAAASSWRPARAQRLASAARGALGGLDVPRFLRARTAAAGLADRSTGHGDYYRRNVLHVPGAGVSVVDWEFVGEAPRWSDHVRFWSTLRRAEDRREAWGRTSEAAGPEGRAHLRTLAGWLGLRLLAENLAAPRHQRDAEDLAHARVLAREARALSDAR